MLLYVLELSGMRRRQVLGWVMLALCLTNVVIAVCETSMQAHLIPPYIGDTLFIENASDFRGTGLFDHPLTGAAVTMLTLLSVPGMRLPIVIAAPCFLLLCMGLIAFGGRTALAVSAITLVIVAICAVIRGLYLRRLQASLCAAIVLATLIVPPAGYVVMTQTPIGDRLAAHFYIDDSAETRSLQWRVLNLLTLREALFGIEEERIPVLVYTLDLDAPFSGIENPWLNTFLKLGAVGCVIYFAALIPFVVHLWRLSALWGRILLVCGFVVLSSSNTLGHKSNSLFLLVAFIAASRGYAADTMPRRSAREPRPRPVIPPLPGPRQIGGPFNPVRT